MKKRSKFPLIALFIQFERTFHQSTDTSKFSAPLIERSKCDPPRIQIGKSQLDKHNLHLMGKMPPRFRHDHFLSIWGQVRKQNFLNISVTFHEFCQDGIDDVALAEETPVLHKRQHFLWKRNGAKSIFYAQRWRSSREY